MQAETLPHNGVATSIAAAKAKASTAAIDRERLAAYYLECGARGSTDHAAELATGINGSTLRPRRGELHKDGIIFPQGERTLPSGYKAQIWVHREFCTEQTKAQVPVTVGMWDAEKLDAPPDVKGNEYGVWLHDAKCWYELSPRLRKSSISDGAAPKTTWKIATIVQQKLDEVGVSAEVRKYR